MGSLMDSSGVDIEAKGESFPVLTIGYGSRRTAEEFVELLWKYEVRYLVDVRSKPFSKFRPEFSREPLGMIMKSAGLVYVFMGDSLGGMPEDAGVDVDGKIDYALCRGRDWIGLRRGGVRGTGWR
jgi:hypothetical protein